MANFEIKNDGQAQVSFNITAAGDRLALDGSFSRIRVAVGRSGEHDLTLTITDIDTGGLLKTVTLVDWATNGGSGGQPIRYLASNGSTNPVRLWTGPESSPVFMEPALIGGPGGGALSGGDASEQILGGPDDDTLSGLGGDDLLHGGAGDDLLEGGEGRDTIYGGEGNDTIYGGWDRDTIYGGAGDDVLIDGGGRLRRLFRRQRGQRHHHRPQWIRRHLLLS